MKIQKDDYDIFIYVEDDIKIPVNAIRYWNELHSQCIENGYNFLRIELDSEGKEYLTDITSRFSYLDTNYIVNDVNPYCAFWIYGKKEFSKFIYSELYNPNNIVGYEDSLFLLIE